MKKKYSLEMDGSQSMSCNGNLWTVESLDPACNKDYGTIPRPKGFGKYHLSLQTLKPVRFTSTESNPLDNAGLLSFSTFSWLTTIMWSMFRKKLDVNSLTPSPSDASEISTERLKRLWEEEVARVGTVKASLVRVVVKFQWTRLLLSILVGALAMTAAFVGPAVLVYKILEYTINLESHTVGYGVALAVSLYITEFFKIFFLSLHWAINLRTAVRLKGAFSSLAFEKILSLRVNSALSMGEMINVVTSDGHRIFEAVLLGGFSVVCPLLFILCIVYACFILGYTALAGVITNVLFLPITIIIGKSIQKFRWIAIKSTDSRVRKINEILTSIKLIKMYAWEDSFEKKVAGMRKEEKKHLRNASYLENANISITTIVPTIATTVTFLVHTALGLPLTPANAFGTIATFNAMRFGLAVLPFCVRTMALASVAVKRLQKILQLKNPEPYLVQGKDPDTAIVMDNATLFWTRPEDKIEPKENTGHTERSTEFKLVDTPTLKNISFTLPKGKLLGVCGSVGSGKTSLISGILEQMHLHKGSVVANGTFAYVSQQAWIFHGTVQENILMGEPFDQIKYDRVLEVCGLGVDLKILPHGDQTEIGERGLNLSGGQKQRISLARAVYSNRDIFLLDDPLSAVDAHVGKHIFEDCIKKELHGKSIILITHQLQYLEYCDSVLLLENGEIAESGHHRNLMKANMHYAQLIANYQMEESKEEEEEMPAQNIVRKVSVHRSRADSGIDNSGLN